MTIPLASLRVRGFRSIRDLELPLTSEVTLLVGANGSGKSNLIAALEILGRIVDGTLQAEILRGGGLAAQLHRGVRGEDADTIILDVWGETQETFTGPIRNGYRVALTSASDDTALLDETTLMHQLDKYPHPYDRPLGLGRESRLKAAAGEHPANQYVLDVLSDCRVFHFDDTSADAPPLRRAALADDVTLHGDARNLAAVLLSMRTQQPVRYQRVVRSIRAVAPFFDDFVLEPHGESVLLRWREKGMDVTFPGSALSSGSLRFICLATLLQQPNAPATIVLDEPELGLHPFAIHQLADLLHEAAQGRRIVAATQSVTLLGQFSVDEVAIVARDLGATTVRRPESAELGAWLEDYSLGELWEMNLLGGRPQPPGSPAVRR
ncbi:AAA family ATPase [Mariniluteicoccus flavus]